MRVHAGKRSGCVDVPIRDGAVRLQFEDATLESLIVYSNATMFHHHVGLPGSVQHGINPGAGLVDK